VRTRITASVQDTARGRWFGQGNLELVVTVKLTEPSDLGAVRQVVVDRINHYAQEKHVPSRIRAVFTFNHS
jgi:hypothetical protein